MDASSSTPADRKSALRRAIIYAVPEYYSWSVIEQERYRLNLPKEQAFRVHQALLKSLFDIVVSTKEDVEEAMAAFDDEQHLLMNSTLLPFHGIGEDDFFLNESLPEGTTLLDFETLGDYARNDHEFQEQARKKEDPSHEIRPYRGDLYPCWARLIIDGEFHYATLQSLTRQLSMILDEAGSERMEALIPHRYVEGKNHGRREPRGTRWDLRLEAGGMEPQLEELRHRYERYLNERHEYLLQRFDAETRQRVYIRREKLGIEPHVDFLFSDKGALDAVRFRHFFNDCQAIAGAIDEWAPLIEQERNAAVKYLDRQFEDIRKNFDPSVVPFRRKRKILLADRVLDDLL
jgi:hypothetical protein